MERLQSKESREMVSFLLVLTTVALDFGGFTLTAPLIPFYVNEYDDAKGMGFGAANSLLTASYGLSQFVATPLSGPLSDRYGRRPVLLLCLIGGSLGFLAQGLANSLWTLCAFRFLTGLFAGSRPVAIVYVADTSTPQTQPARISAIAATANISMFIAPIIGGSMGLVDLRLPCFFFAVVAFAFFVLAYWHILEPEKGNKGKPQPGAPANQPKKAWKFPVLINALVGMVSMGILAGWQTLLPAIGSMELGLNQNDLGLIQSLAGLTNAFAQFFVFVPLSKRLRLPFVGLMGTAMLATPGLVVPFDDKLWPSIVASSTHSLGAALTTPGVSVMGNMLSPPAIRGTVISFTLTFQALSRVVFPVLVGLLFDESQDAPFLLLAGAAIVGAACELFLSTRIKTLAPRPGAQKPGEQPATQLAPAAAAADKSTADAPATKEPDTCADAGKKVADPAATQEGQTGIVEEEALKAVNAV